MRRAWLLVLVALPFIAGGTASYPTRANAQDVFGLMTAPLRMLQRNLGVRGRLYHRRHRARPAAAPRHPEPRRNDVARDSDRAITVSAGYWPDAYVDLVGFAFAPDKHERFWSHGAADLLTASLSPSATTRASLARRAAKAKNASACAEGNDDAEDAATSAYQELETRVQPTAEQRAAFDELRKAFLAAAKRVNTSCAAGYATARPPERLAILADRISAARHAMLIVRTPLEKAYNTLSDEQKKAIDGPAPAAVNCTADLAAAGTWPGAEINRALNPNDKQQVALEKLRLTFLGMSQNLSSFCPQKPLTTALARLDAAGDRLNTLNYAALVVNRSLNSAYAALDNEQKARLQLVGRQLRIGTPRSADLSR